MSEELENSSRQLMYMPVSRVALERIFIGGTQFTVTDGLPKDARIVGMEYKADRDCYRVTFESDEFDEVPEGMKVPRHSGVVIESETNE